VDHYGFVFRRAGGGKGKPIFVDGPSEGPARGGAAVHAIHGGVDPIAQEKDQQYHHGVEEDPKAPYKDSQYSAL